PQPTRRRRARRQQRTARAPRAVPPAAPAPAQPARARRTRAPRATPTRSPAASLQRFAVQYQVERIIRATSIQDALRQVEALGAADVIPITGEDCRPAADAITA